MVQKSVKPALALYFMIGFDADVFFYVAYLAWRTHIQYTVIK